MPIDAGGLTCVKRDGSVVAFDPGKVAAAVRKCFAASGVRDGPAEAIAAAVVNTLAGARQASPTVEEVQRLVIQQLWSRGLFAAGEEYQNYREAHRRARLEGRLTPEVVARVGEDQRHFATDLQYYQFMSKFSRWREAEGRRETWREAVYERVCPWLFKLAGRFGGLTPREEGELAGAMYDLEVSPAMRVVQMAGPALDRCHVGAYNCAYAPTADVRSFSELLYVLMQGTGQGFSVESEYVSRLPRVRKDRGLKPDVIRVPDTTEGWCDALHGLLERLWDGHDAFLDVTAVRPKDAVLRTKGGRASGPGPLLELAAFARTLLKSRRGRFLEDIDAHDLNCVIGKVVQVGGVRRAAEISLSDLDSAAMRGAKAGNWYTHAVHRTMANNSAVYDFDGPVPVDVFMEEWLALVKSKSGERGIFNRRAALQHSPPRRKWGDHKPGGNPCLEILLRPFQFCNLSIVIARPGDTVETLRRKVRLATIFGKVQSLATDFNYIRPDWKRNCEEERLLGVDITGHADCPLLRFDAPGRRELLRELAKVVYDTDLEFSERFGVNQSAANTTVKPGGDSAVLFDCASGVSPRFAQRQVRWVRETKGSPVARFLVESGVPHADAPEAPGELFVFGFPKEAPAGSTLRNDMTAEQQFHNWLEWKREWAEHSVSATVYVEDHEWPRLGALVYESVGDITGLSFLPKDNGAYTYAPNEELTEAQYAAFCKSFPADLNWAKLVQYETRDETGGRQTFACVGPDGCG